MAILQCPNCLDEMRIVAIINDTIIVEKYKNCIEESQENCQTYFDESELPSTEQGRYE